MKNTQSVVPGLAALLLLIMDTETAVSGAIDGMELCIGVLIPSLFPFFIVTSYLSSTLTGFHMPGIGKIENALRLPAGGGSILILGLIGGYPVGAQLLANACHEQDLDKRTGRIMLGFCSNAGPAFIFGVARTLFSSIKISILLWCIQILSALVTAFLLPKPYPERDIPHKSAVPSLVAAVKKSVVNLASVCSWVVIFRIILNYLQLWIKNPYVLLLCSGFLELSNGCVQLNTLSGDGIRLVLCSLFLAFGGICVFMQTASVAGSLGMGLYLPGRVIQASVSTCIAMIFTMFLYPHTVPVITYILAFPACCCFILLAKKYAEKDVEIQEKI